MEGLNPVSRHHHDEMQGCCRVEHDEEHDDLDWDSQLASSQQANVRLVEKPHSLINFEQNALLAIYIEKMWENPVCFTFSYIQVGDVAGSEFYSPKFLRSKVGCPPKIFSKSENIGWN